MEIHRKAAALRQVFSGAELAHSLLDQAIDVAKGDAGCIYVLTPDGRHLRQIVSRNIPAALTRVELPVGHGVSGTAAATRQTQRIDHYPSHPLAREPFLSHNLQAAMACPLISEDQLVGVLSVTSKTVGHKFGPWEVGAAELVGVHLADVVRSAQLG